EFLRSFCNDDAFISERRKVLRTRAGLKDSDKNLVPKFRFIVLEGKKFGENEVENDHNYEIALQYMATFAHQLPRRRELEERCACMHELSKCQLHEPANTIGYKASFQLQNP
ncbi:unnamed protein product, partial [Durusdinium trenchii]